MATKAPAKLPAKVDPKTTSLASPNDDFFGQFAGAGLENVNSTDMLIPRLTIIQALSPQLQRKKAEFIEGSEIGDIVDVSTGELFKDGLLFVPVYYRKDWLEWAPRASGEGLVNIHHDPAIMDKTTRNERKQPVLENGNIISETAQFFGFNLTAGRRRCFIPLSSTQLKKAKKWITLATSEKLRRADGSEYVAPLFFRSYSLTTAEESNNQGDWAGWNIARGPSLPEMANMPELDLGVSWDQIGREAVEFRDSLIAGQMQGDMRDLSQDPSADDNEVI